MTSKSRHTNNWAVIVDASRYWLNYRHVANALSFYHTVKRLGIPDSNIILMLADDMACNSRNILPGSVFNKAQKDIDLYSDNIEVDYRGYEVNVENFIRLLTGRQNEYVPRSKRLLTDDRSNILIFLTGHGGDEFLKFQSKEDISSQDLADAFAQMREKRRYNEILFMIDTCQANTLYSRFYSPNLIASGSSEKGENSFSHQTDGDLGVAVIDRYTYYSLEVLERVQQGGNDTLMDLFSSYSKSLMGSTPGFRYDLFKRPVEEVLITDFFGAVQPVEITKKSFLLNEKFSVFKDQQQLRKKQHRQSQGVGHNNRDIPQLLTRQGDLQPMLLTSVALQLAIIAVICIVIISKNK